MRPRRRRSLKEHFILERIAEEENIEAEEGDFEKEIFLIAMQSGESPRRVRAQIEKRGLMDVLQNQIIERKVLELVQANAKFTDKPLRTRKAGCRGPALGCRVEGTRPRRFPRPKRLPTKRLAKRSLP